MVFAPSVSSLSHPVKNVIDAMRLSNLSICHTQVQAILRSSTS